MIDEIEKKLLEEIEQHNNLMIDSKMSDNHGELLAKYNKLRGQLEQHRQTKKWVKENELTFLELLLHLNPSEPVKRQIEIRKKQISGEKNEYI